MSGWMSLLALLLVGMSIARGEGLDIRLLVEGSPVLAAGASFPSPGQPVRIGFRIGAGDGRTAMAGLHPGAWIRPRNKGRSSCKDAVRNYLGQGPNATRDISLNGYTFITLNNDQTLAVLDPRLNLASSNLLALTSLGGNPVDWRMAPERDLLFIALREPAQLLVIDAVTAIIRQRIPLPDQPVALLVAEQRVWVAGSHGSLAVFDPRRGQLVETLKVGKGRLFVASDSAGRRVFAYASGRGHWVKVDARNREILSRGQVAPGLRGLVYSTLADRIFLAWPEKHGLLTLFPSDHPEPATIGVGIEADTLAISPGGRWLLAADGKEGAVALVDTAIEDLTHGLQFVHPFDQVVFSENYVYLRHTDVARVSLIHLPSLHAGIEPGVIEVHFGVKPPAAITSGSAGSAIAPLPLGGGAVVASPGDRTLFLYMEDGMRAPMNAFRSWTAPPVAVIIHDRSLRETRPGHYEAITAIPAAGAYEVVFHLPSPPEIRCWPLDVGEIHTFNQPIAPRPATGVKVLSRHLSAGKPVLLEIALVSAGVREQATNDLKIVLFRPGSSWQYRDFARPLGGGRYRLPVTFPSPGRYRLAVESIRLGMRISRDQMHIVEVKPP